MIRTEAKEKFIKELKDILDKYPIEHFIDGSISHLNKRKELQVIFRNAEQYRLGMLLKKWSKSDIHITDDEIAKTYFQCVLHHFQTDKYLKR